MEQIYPNGSNKINIISHLEELRKRIIIVVISVVLCAISAFAFGSSILAFVRRPSLELIPELIFLGPAEAFASYLKISLITGIFFSFPIALYQFWLFISPAIDSVYRKKAAKWLILSCFMFFLGSAFSYYIAFPRALSFLMQFGARIAVPAITIGKYFSFFCAVFIVGGVTFQMPIVITFIVDIGLVSTGVLRKKRPLAVISMLVLAAIVTPTQDIFNMLIFAVPMLLLYEVGIFAGQVIEKRKK